VRGTYILPWLYRPPCEVVGRFRSLGALQERRDPTPAQAAAVGSGTGGVADAHPLCSAVQVDAGVARVNVRSILTPPGWPGPGDGPTLRALARAYVDEANGSKVASESESRHHRARLAVQLATVLEVEASMFDREAECVEAQAQTALARSRAYRPTSRRRGRPRLEMRYGGQGPTRCDPLSRPPGRAVTVGNDEVEAAGLQDPGRARASEQKVRQPPSVHADAPAQRFEADQVVPDPRPISSPTGTLDLLTASPGGRSRRVAPAA